MKVVEAPTLDAFGSRVSNWKTTYSTPPPPPPPPFWFLLCQTSTTANTPSYRRQNNQHIDCGPLNERRKTKVTERTAQSLRPRSLTEQHDHRDKDHLENSTGTEIKVTYRTTWSQTPRSSREQHDPLKHRSPREQLDHWDQGHLDNSKITETKVTKRTVEASKGQDAVKLTTNVCSGVPWKASMSRMTEPLVEMRINLPSGLNFNPVQSHSLSCGNLNVANGPWKETTVKQVTEWSDEFLLARPCWFLQVVLLDDDELMLNVLRCHLTY